MPLKTLKYRLYPTKAQREKLEWTLDRCRELYNAALQERRDTWNVCKKHPRFYDPQWRKEHTAAYSISYYDQSAQLPEIKELRPEYKDIYAQVLQDVLKRVKKTFDAFFQRVKAGQKPGYPRFQNASRFDSFTYPQAGFSFTHDNQLCLSKIGSIKAKLHRPIEGVIKTCTLKREGTHWYVCFACEVEQITRHPYTDDAVGIDLGITHFAALSTGDFIENPRYYRKAEKKLEKAQQTFARKKKKDSKGCKGNRRKKAARLVGKCHRTVRNQRSDFLHKQARQLVNTYETIIFEDITPSKMSKRPKPKQDEQGKYLPNGASQKAGLNKSILDAGWSTFIAMCQSKAEEAGTVTVILVDPRYTSQVCSQCGVIRKKELSERWHSCECGASLDRDHNAALNILRLGRSLQGSRP